MSVDSNFTFNSFAWLCTLALLHRLLCKLILIDKTLCLYFTLKWFLFNSFGEMCFLEDRYKKSKFGHFWERPQYKIWAYAFNKLFHFLVLQSLTGNIQLDLACSYCSPLLTPSDPNSSLFPSRPIYSTSSCSLVFSTNPRVVTTTHMHCYLS